MKKIIYYVACSLDGYIAGKNDDISQFILEGEGVEKYHSDLAQFSTVIMGRKTYEFGYQYGLDPGKPAYPNMDHFIFSNSLEIATLSDQVHIEKMDINKIQEIKETSVTDIYLCGGGDFAGWLLEHNMIDELKLKLNPVIIGDGVKLFGGSKVNAKWSPTESESFSDGLQILSFERNDS